MGVVITEVDYEKVKMNPKDPEAMTTVEVDDYGFCVVGKRKHAQM